MSMSQILQVIVVANNALADEMIGTPDKERIGAVVDILGMLEDTLENQMNGGVSNG